MMEGEQYNMKKQLMIDYRDEKGKFVRRVIDDLEFCVRDDVAYFISEGVKYAIPIGNISQMYTY